MRGAGEEGGGRVRRGAEERDGGGRAQVAGGGGAREHVRHAVSRGGAGAGAGLLRVMLGECGNGRMLREEWRVLWSRAAG